MFIVDDSFRDFSALQETLVSVLQSINEPKVAAEGRMPQPTQAFVFTAQAKRKLETRIVLFLVGAGETVTYKWSDGPFDPSRKGEVEEAALDFVEGMGFMMDNLNFAKLAPDQKAALLGEIPVFREAAASSVEEELLEAIPEEDPKIPSLSAETKFELDALDLEAVSAPPAGASKEPRPQPAVVAPDGESPDILESEFERSDAGLSEELDSIFGTLDAGPVKEEPGPVSLREAELSPGPAVSKNAPRVADEKWRAWIRLMASF